ncbi:MAG: DNA gyrase inhibitor YacG [Planctomycetes bacterium]|nr:DNA gyrase inhibitor YacG [Planctomycetota bacterium]
MNSIRCPICGRDMPAAGPGDWPDRPFCSSRCRLIDLGRWLGGDYCLPAAPSDTEPESEADEAERN